MKKVYTFVYGVDGFGQDISPAYEHGVYQNYKDAFEKQKELNKDVDFSEYYFYEDGYGEGYYPDTNLILAKAEEEEDWETYELEFSKHQITDLETICKLVNENADEYVPSGICAIVECELK